MSRSWWSMGGVVHNIEVRAERAKCGAEKPPGWKLGVPLPTDDLCVPCHAFAFGTFANGLDALLPNEIEHASLDHHPFDGCVSGADWFWSWSHGVTTASGRAETPEAALERAVTMLRASGELPRGEWKDGLSGHGGDCRNGSGAREALPGDRDFVDGIFDGRDQVDALHPSGRCTCWGEGRCALCLEWARKEAAEDGGTL